MMHDKTKQFIGGLLILASFWLKDWVYYVFPDNNAWARTFVILIYLIVVIAGLLMIIYPSSKK